MKSELTRCIWKSVYENGSINDGDCEICSGYNPLCERFYSRQKRKAEDSPLNPTIIPTAQGDYKAVGEEREICKPQTLCSADTYSPQEAKPSNNAPSGASDNGTILGDTIYYGLRKTSNAELESVDTFHSHGEDFPKSHLTTFYGTFNHEPRHGTSKTVDLLALLRHDSWGVVV